MLFLVSILSIMLAFIFYIFSLKEKTCKKWQVAMTVSIVTCIASLITSSFILERVVICQNEKSNISITDTENFKLKVAGEFATWDDAEGSTYIVPIDIIELKFSDEFKITKSKETQYYPKWARFLLDFAFFGYSDPRTTVTYELELPETSIVYTNVET